METFSGHFFLDEASTLRFAMSPGSPHLRSEMRTWNVSFITTGVVATQIFLEFSPHISGKSRLVKYYSIWPDIWGRWTHFDVHIFFKWVGKNHQLDNFTLASRFDAFLLYFAPYPPLSNKEKCSFLNSTNRSEISSYLPNLTLLGGSSQDW